MKRWYDTNIWRKRWFMELSPAEKLAWQYITSDCDNVGVWDPNRPLAEFLIGSAVDWDALPDKCNGNIEVLPDGKWWLVDFCAFQHQDLVANPDGGNSKALRSYVSLLKKHGIYERWLSIIDSMNAPVDAHDSGHSDGHNNGHEDEHTEPTTVGPIDMARERAREQAREEEERKNAKNGSRKKREPDLVLGECKNVRLTSDEFERLKREHSPPIVEEAINYLSMWKEEKGRRVKNDNLALRRWTLDAVYEKRARGSPQSSSAEGVIEKLKAEGVFDDEE